MRSVIISSVLLAILIISIAVNAYYVNSLSTELLDMIFLLPGEYGYIRSLNDEEIESLKSEINKISAKWDKNAFRISLVSRYTDFDRTNSAVYSVKEYFFAGCYADYIVARKKLIAALEKQKYNELPNIENIL